MTGKDIPIISYQAKLHSVYIITNTLHTYVSNIRKGDISK